MSTKRIPIHRPIRAQIPPEALDLFREMKTLKCTCRPIDWKGKYWERDECSEMQTVVEPALAVGPPVARDTTLALASHPKSSRRVPLPGGVTCGSAVDAERNGSGQMARA